jgi:nickel-dependent lactate racemase
MKIELPYSETKVEANIDWASSVNSLTISEIAPLADVNAALDAAFDDPIAQSESVFQRVQPGEQLTIVVSDSFRKTGIDQLLPRFLERMNERGVKEDDIRFLVATGVHRGPTPVELDEILGADIHRRFTDHVHIHDAHDASTHVRVGETSRGTPVEANKLAVECDRLIVTGSVVLHYFGGFGGGRKSLLPGLCSANTIAHNHSRNLDEQDNRLDPNVRIGEMDGNPVAEDMLEGALLIGADCMVNTVLNRNGDIARIFAGDLEIAHREATTVAKDIFSVPLETPADLVVAASANTRNFVQTHKALYNAFQAAKPNGQIILLAPCPEGLGGEQFEKWLRLGSTDEIIRQLRQQSEINGQTALSTIEKAQRCIMVTEMSDSDVTKLGAVRAATLDDALALARERLVEDGISESSVITMPEAAYSVPAIPAAAI